MPFVFKDGSVAGICSVCGEPGWSIRSNKCAEHRTSKPTKLKAEKVKTVKKGEPSVNADGSPGERAKQFVETAGDITSKTFSGKAPSASEWEEKLTALVVLATMTYVEYVVVRPFHLPEPHASEAVSVLGMTDDEARTIIEPCSFLLARSEINKKHGREAIEILAFAPAILAIVSWADRVSSFRQQMQAQLGDPNVSFERPQAPSGATETSGGAPIANFRGVTDPREAPTSRVNGDRPHLDVEDRTVST
jgi:hypothetical protein